MCFDYRKTPMTKTLQFCCDKRSIEKKVLRIYHHDISEEKKDTNIKQNL